VAKRTITVDDLTGVAAETKEVKVKVNGQEKTLDLTEQSLAALQALGTPEASALFAKLFTAPSNGSSGSTGNGSKSARRTNANGSTGNGGSGRTAEELADIRAWAKETGYKQASGKPVADIGRVAADVIAAYGEAQKK
jgi:hypothetical protein